MAIDKIDKNFDLRQKINVDGEGYWEGQYDAFELIEEYIDRLNFL